MGESREKRPIRNAGAFLSDGRGMAGIPMSTLSDEWHDEPPEPEENDMCQCVGQTFAIVVVGLDPYERQ